MKTNGTEGLARQLTEETCATGLFAEAGKESKYSMDRPFSEEESRAVFPWLDEAANATRAEGLTE